MTRANATLTVSSGDFSAEARFNCDQEINLEAFEAAVAAIARFGGYATLALHSVDPDSPVQTQDCILRTGVEVDWETWMDISQHLSRILGINVTSE